MLLQAMSALPGKDWYLGGSKGFEGKKGPFGKTPEKLQQCFINSEDPLQGDRGFSKKATKNSDRGDRIIT